MTSEIADLAEKSLIRGKSSVSRAELLWSLKTLDPDQHQQIAIILGFERQLESSRNDDQQDREQSDKQSDQGEKGQENRDDPESKVIKEPQPLAATSSSYYRIASRAVDQTQNHVGTDTLSLPDWFTQASPTLLIETATRIPACHQVKPLYTGLAAWSRLLPFLQKVLGDQVEGRKPDTVRLVKQVANGEMIRRIPRKQRHSWAIKARVLIDVNEDNFPYRRDFLQLRDQLMRLRGDEGLDIQYIYDEPGGTIARYDQQRKIIELWRLPESGTPILILSDLAMHSQSRQSLYGWLAFGQMLNAQGWRTTVLMPVAERNIDVRLLKYFDCVVWDRASRFKLVKGDYQTGKDERNHANSIDQLLSYCFAGVRVESGLLRALRHMLPGDYDIGHETAIWRHLAVVREGDEWGWLAESKPGFFERAQQSIAGLAFEQKQKLVELIGRYHAQYPDELYFEAMYNLKLLGLPLPEAVEAATEKFLRDMVRTYQAHADNSLLHAWVKRHLTRHEAKPIRQQHRYWIALMAFAKKRDEQVGGASTSEWPSDLSDEEKEAAWNFLNATQVSRVYQLRQSGEKLVLVPEKSEAVQADGSQTDLPDAWSTHAIAGTTLLTLRLTDTHIFHTHTDRQGQQSVVSLNLESSRGHSFQFLATGQHTFQIGAERITVDVSAAQQRKTDWMTFIGSSSEGMFAESKDAQNRVYRWFWHAPLLINRQTLYPGFWYSEPQLAHATFKPDWAGAAGRDEYGLYADAIIASIKHRFRWIEPTSFMMGSPEDEAGRSDDESQHFVILTQGYWLAETACTQALWQEVMRNSSRFQGEQLPVETVSWEDAQNFMKRLNYAHRQLQLRLPTEAEWENACRAGTTSAFNFDDELSFDKVNYRGTLGYESDKEGEGALQQTTEVKNKKYRPNAWGLFQMHGNVWELCQDWYGEYPSQPVIDPQGPELGNHRVLRGGSWIDNGRDCRSAARYSNVERFRGFNFGFRLARGHELKSSRVLGADQQPVDRSATERAKAQTEDGLRGSDKEKSFMDRMKDLFKGGDEV